MGTDTPEGALRPPAIMYVELAMVAALIVLNGLLAMSELAIVSSRPGRLKAPRHELDMIDIGDDVAMIRRRIVASMHTYLPVYDGEADGVIGVLQAKDLLGKGENLSVDELRGLVRPAPVVPDNMDALDVVDLFAIPRRISGLCTTSTAISKAS